MANIYYETGGGVVIVDDQVLLLDRPTRAEVRLPKGHIDPGETSDITALRETQEESGYVDLEIIDDLGCELVDFEKNGDQVTRAEYYYLMTLKSQKQIRRSEVDEAQFRPIWVAFDQAMTLLTFPAERQVLEKAIERYKSQK